MHDPVTGEVKSCQTHMSGFATYLELARRL